MKSPTRRKRDLSVDEIIQVASEEVEQSGWDALSLATVAKRIGVQPPSLYNHIDGLPHLRRLLSLFVARELGQVMQRAAIGRSSDDAVHAIAQAQRTFAREHSRLYAATATAPLDDDPAAQAIATEVVELALAVLRPYHLSRSNGIHAVRALRSAVHGFAALEAAGGFGMPIEVDRSFQWLIDSLLVGIRAAGTKSENGDAIPKSRRRE